MYSLGVRGFWLYMAQLSCPKCPSHGSALGEKAQISQTDLLDDISFAYGKVFFPWSSMGNGSRGCNANSCTGLTWVSAQRPLHRRHPSPNHPSSLNTQQGCGWLPGRGRHPPTCPRGYLRAIFCPDHFGILIKILAFGQENFLATISHPTLHNWAAWMG